jgi:formate dehydrogenase (NADP+) alpha subunit
MTREKRLNVTIDNKKVEVRPGLTILQAARENGVYIPSLCTLEQLPSYGACRLCVVEVDGLRGFPTSCTTPVEDGMIIRTDTAEIKSLRQEVLKLLLSEHPASCLFCTEQDECKDYQGTIRKVGATTGCRYCPNDNRCELQQITEKIGLTETSYPVYYRNFPVEKYDPFYDRDYNLCILCGRCVRVCNDVRLNGTLSFKQRGKQTTIGPAFDRGHAEAGCEFCGACVSVCPTGALSAKVSKWYGKPDAQEVTTCGYCSVGCQLTLQMKNNEVLDALPDYDSPVDHGLLCVKGRFAVPEYTHSPLRFTNPRHLISEGYEDITWERAIEIASEKFAEADPADCLMVVSPNLTNEDLFVAQQFMREAVGTDAIASSLLVDLGKDLLPFLELGVHSSLFDVIDTAEAILSIGFDSTYGYSPIGVAAKTAVRRGATLVTLGAEDSNLDILSEVLFRMDGTGWPDLLDALVDGQPKKAKQKKLPPILAPFADGLERVGGLFSVSSRKVVIVGPGVLQNPRRSEVLDILLKYRDMFSFKVIIAHPYANLAGMAALGAFPGIKAGQMVRDKSGPTSITILADNVAIDLKTRRKILYMVGEVPSADLPPGDFLIYQNILPYQGSREPDLILPATPFPESAGTMVNAEGRVLNIRKVIEPVTDAKPDWWIMSRIAAKMNKGKPKYTGISAIQAEIRKYVRGFPDIKKAMQFLTIDLKKRGKTPAKTVPKTRPGTGADTYRGIPLSEVVSGMRAIERRNHE